MRELLPSTPEEWFETLDYIASIRDLSRRYGELGALHDESLSVYVNWLFLMNEEEAAQPAFTSPDQLTRQQVVLHITGWDRWMTQVFSALNKQQAIQEMMQLRGYYDDVDELPAKQSAQQLSFVSQTEFDHYQLERYQGLNWAEVKARAEKTSRLVHYYFPKWYHLEWVQFLEQTPVYQWKWQTGQELELPFAWYLWMASITHPVLEHKADLEIERPSRTSHLIR